MKTKFKILKDKLEVVFGLRHPLLPPRRYDNINLGDNLQIGEEFLKYFIEFGKINPESKILEIGSGYGRMAIPLTTYLSTKGRYYGLDIMKDGINWCKTKFTKKYPNFKFEQIDLYKSSEIDIIMPIKYGSWSGRKDALSFQDIIIGKK